MQKILVIDDDPDFIEITKVHLEGAGYEVCSANNRPAGLKAVQDEKPELVILDVMMDSEDDGFVLAQDLRKKGFKTPIIMLTSVGSVSGLQFDRDDEMVPVDVFLQKPVEPETLLGKVKELLGKEKN